MNEFLQFLLLLLGFVGVLIAAHFTAKFVGKKMGHIGSARYMKVVERMAVGSEKFICLVRMGHRYYMLGVTNNHIDLLDKIEENELAPLRTSEEAPFHGVLERYIKKRQPVVEGEEKHEGIE